MDLLLHLRQEHGFTLLIATHDLAISSAVSARFGSAMGASWSIGPKRRASGRDGLPASRAMS